jgi:peptidoglycan/LPS O-acetylase OafA/YrhL
LVTAFAFSPLFELIKHGDFSADSALAYVRGNWAMFHLNEWSMRGIMNLHPSTIGEALRDNPQPSGINGSLWSLPYECVCYAVLALLGALGVLRRGRFSFVILYGVFWALYAFSCLDAEYFRECFPSPWVQPIVMLALYFSAGCVCYLYRESIPASKILCAASVLLLAAGLTFGSFGLVAPLAMSYAAICLAFWLPIRRFDAWGDFSYGTYIYAFPVQQGLALLGVHKHGLMAFLACTVLITLLLAALSYHCVEGPSLRWKDVNLFRKRKAASIEDAIMPESELEACRSV